MKDQMRFATLGFAILLAASAFAQTDHQIESLAAAFAPATYASPADTGASGPDSFERFVSPDGKDSFDGKSWASPKASIAAALASLPSITVRRQNYPAGTVRLAGGTYTVNQTITTMLNFVRIVGQGRYATTIDCAAPVCFSWNNSSGTGGDPAEGGLYSLTLNGNGSANQVGLSTVDGNGLHLEGVKIAGFNGASAVGWKGINATSETERTLLLDAWFHDNTTGISLTGTAARNSFMHNTWLAVQFNLARPEQVAIALGPHSLFQANVVTGVINNDNRTGNTYAWSIDTGPGVGFDTFLALYIDNNGRGTVYGVNFVAGTPSFQPWGSFGGYTVPMAGTGTFATALPGLAGAQYRILQAGNGGPAVAYPFGPFQVKRSTTGCVTASAPGSTCTTTIYWPKAFADTNYTAVCNGTTIATGSPADAGFTNKRPNSVDAVTVAVTGAHAGFATIDCVAHHDP